MNQSGRLKHTIKVLQFELGGYHPRNLALSLLLKLLPPGWAIRTRALVYRAFGMSIGPGSTITGTITFGKVKGKGLGLTIGANTFINREVYIDSGAPVFIGDYVAIGHHVVIITTDHEMGDVKARAGDLQCKSVTIEDGAWIAAGVTLLPGVTVGKGAVVAAGAVVTRDVAPNTLVGGVPAKLIRTLPTDRRSISTE